jgi:DNA-binding transcriptional regulator YhcF (GntR family)
LTIDIQISNENKTPLYVQIAKQIKNLIGSGALKEGDPLPRRQDLVRQLGVNINTINHTYRILENEGYVYSKRGVGSFVKQRFDDRTRSALFEEIRGQLKELKRLALAIGLSLEDYGQLVKESFRNEHEPSKPRAVFIECHEAWTDEFALSLQQELGIEVKPVVMPDRETNLKEVIHSIKASDLIITTHHHFNDIRQIAGAKKWIFPLDLHLSYELMNELATLKGAQVAVPFLKPTTVKRLGHSIKAVGFPINLIPIQHRDLPDLVRKMKGYKTLLVPKNHLKEVKDVVPEGVRILTIKSVLGEESIQRLKESLSKAYTIMAPSFSSRDFNGLGAGLSQGSANERRT